MPHPLDVVWGNGNIVLARRISHFHRGMLPNSLSAQSLLLLLLSPPFPRATQCELVPCLCQSHVHPTYVVQVVSETRH